MTPDRKREIQRKFRDKHRAEINAAYRERYAAMSPAERKKSNFRKSRAEFTRRWRNANLERARFLQQRRAKKRYATNPEKVRQEIYQWRANNPDKVRAIAKRYHEKRYASDPAYKLRGVLRCRFKAALRRNAQTSSILSLLGCSIPDFKLYIESKFESGMSWETYGLHGWHIDHIMPCAIFDLSKPEHQKRCFHFSNYQPLWATDNLKKGKRVKSDQLLLV